jgi:lysophospholipase L1-like esterase
MYWNKLLDKLSTTQASVIVTDLIPVIEDRYSEQASLIRRNSDVERYNEIIKNICKQKNILFFSRYENWINRNLKELYKDATHPNANGHQIMAEEIYEYLQKKQII